MLATHLQDLSEGELERLVRGLAADPGRWDHLVMHRPDERTYAELYRDQHVAVWLICWMNDHDTAYHNHDMSAGPGRGRAGSGRGEGAPSRWGGARCAGSGSCSAALPRRARRRPARRSRSARPTSTA